MKSLKILAILLLTSIMAFSAEAQKDKSKRKSPPAQVSKEINGKTVTIDYSQPSKRDREIFGGIVPFDKVWRTGANETSWIEFSEDVKVDGKKLAAGKYGLFTIPGEEKWTIIFNKAWNGWGAYEYKDADDVLRIDIAPVSGDLTELFTIDIKDEGDIVLAWDTTKVQFSVD